MKDRYELRVQMQGRGPSKWVKDGFYDYSILPGPGGSACLHSAEVWGLVEGFVCSVADIPLGEKIVAALNAYERSQLKARVD